MSAAEEYTPSRQVVRSHCAASVAGERPDVGHTLACAEFDRWLAKHDAEVKAEALREAAEAEESRCTGDWNGATCDTCRATAKRLRVRADSLHPTTSEES